MYDVIDVTDVVRGSTRGGQLVFGLQSFCIDSGAVLMEAHLQTKDKKVTIISTNTVRALTRTDAYFWNAA